MTSWLRSLAKAPPAGGPSVVNRVAKVAIAIVCGAFGFALLLTTLSLLAPRTDKRENNQGPRQISMAVSAPKPPPKKKKQRKQKAKKSRAKARSASAPPRIGNALGAMDFGLPSAGADGLGLGVDKSLLGATDDVVMTESTVDELPRPLARPAPEMPARARRQGIEGRVLLRLRIDTKGRVVSATVEESTNAELFNEVAIDAAKKWRYAPARYRGDAVAISALQPIEFRLEAAR